MKINEEQIRRRCSKS